MKAVLLAAALALAAPAASAGAGAQPAAGPWVVVQADGARVTFEAPPELREGRWVGRMRGTGTLVSIPAARVDAAATARANAPGAAGEKPPPKPSPTPRPFETPPLGDRAKLKVPADEAGRIIEGAQRGTPDPVPAATDAARAAPESSAEPAGPTDRTGRDEAWWRERAGAVRGEYEQAGQALAEAEARLESAERAFLGTSRAERNTFVIRVNEERAAAERAREEHRRAAAAWDALQEEARKSGAFPGWLR